jgi:hypothetical protein
MHVTNRLLELFDEQLDVVVNRINTGPLTTMDDRHFVVVNTLNF